MECSTDVFEIAVSFDTTGSMYSCLEEVKVQLHKMVNELKIKIPGIRIAIIAHGDYCDKLTSYVTKYIDFTNDPELLSEFVKNVGKTSGGDPLECYELVMREVQENLTWSGNSHKALVMIGDSSPHEPDEDQNYLHLDWRKEVQSLREMDIKIYAVQCKGHSERTSFYQHISSKTFGYYMPLSNINGVTELLMNICYREAGIKYAFSPEAILRTENDLSSERMHEEPPTLKSDIETDECKDDDLSDEEIEMRCFLCKQSKPPNEFPKSTLSEKCRHYPGYCLRCAVKYVKDNTGQCPHPSCSVIIEESSDRVKFFKTKLAKMFVDYADVEEKQRKMACRDGPVISISTINGDTAWLPYDSTMTISALKKSIASKFGIKDTQQKVMYGDIPLKVKEAPDHQLTLEDYSIKANSSLLLMVPLYCIPESLDHVVFDLSWDFPQRNPDFLDASCLAFENSEFIQVIDWNHSANQYYLKGAVEHTAKNIKTAGGQIGHQSINVYIKQLPSNITHLFFTLSSWKAPDLSAFKRPSLQFYEASDPSTRLCRTTISHALSSQAVIMCSLVKAGSEWQIYPCDKNGCASGNTKRYNPIRKHIADLIDHE